MRFPLFTGICDAASLDGPARWKNLRERAFSFLDDARILLGPQVGVLAIAGPALFGQLCRKSSVGVAPVLPFPVLCDFSEGLDAWSYYLRVVLPLPGMDAVSPPPFQGWAVATIALAILADGEAAGTGVVPFPVSTALPGGTAGFRGRAAELRLRGDQVLVGPRPGYSVRLNRTGLIVRLDGPLPLRHSDVIEVDGVPWVYFERDALLERLLPEPESGTPPRFLLAGCSIPRRADPEALRRKAGPPRPVLRQGVVVEETRLRSGDIFASGSTLYRAVQVDAGIGNADPRQPWSRTVNASTAGLCVARRIDLAPRAGATTVSGVGFRMGFA